MFGNGSQPQQNAAHKLDDALGRWVKNGGTYTNFDGWKITRVEPGEWSITRPGADAPEPYGRTHGRIAVWSSLTVAKREAERLMAGAS